MCALHRCRLGERADKPDEQLWPHLAYSPRMDDKAAAPTADQERRTMVEHEM